MIDQAVVEIEHVEFAYHGQPVLEDVSLEVKAKGFLALIGPNGGGKTTLMKLMLGLLKPDSGTIRIFGEAPAKEVHRVGYVPQNVHINQNFPISVLDVVMMGRLSSGKKRSFYTKKDRRVAREVMNEMAIWEYRHHRIGELSGGERQRVFIARALATEPEMLFLDEPTAGVDAKGQADLYDLLKGFNENLTIIIVSHDLMILSQHIKSVACVNLGLHYHDEAEITQEMVEMCHCAVDLIAHGMPHRVLKAHTSATISK
jgi:zinc transport system ATP-binding protein